MMAFTTIMNSKTRANFSKAITNEYIVDDYYEGALVFRRGFNGDGAFFAVPASRSEACSYEGKMIEVTHDTGLSNVRGGYAKLVGWAGKDGVRTGDVPPRSVPVYVFK